MNCLEFRRRLAVEPKSDAPEFVAHRDDCPRCAEAYARAQQFEAGMVRALAVAVPADLADRILLHQTTAARQIRHRGTSPALWRIAASLLVAVGVFSLWSVSTPAAALADLAVAHLAHEPYAFNARGTVSTEEVRALFRARGVVLAADPNTVNYLQLCKLGNAYTVHMVVQEADGPVTIYYVIGRREAERSVFERQGMKGRSIPLGEGTLVMLGMSDRAFDRLEQHWIMAVGEGA
jgi:muconolactone delta-isomerase